MSYIAPGCLLEGLGFRTESRPCYYLYREDMFTLQDAVEYYWLRDLFALACRGKAAVLYEGGRVLMKLILLMPDRNFHCSQPLGSGPTAKTCWI